MKSELKTALLNGEVEEVKVTKKDCPQGVVQTPGGGGSYTVVDRDSNIVLYDNWSFAESVVWGAVGAVVAPNAITRAGKAVVGGAVRGITSKITTDTGPNYQETKLIKWYSYYWGQYVYQTSHTMYSGGQGSSVSDIYVSGTLDKVRALNGYGWDYTDIN